MPKRIACVATLLAVILWKVSAAQSQQNAWQKLDVPTTASFRGLSAVSASVVWVSGTEGTIIRTTDAGATWSVHKVDGGESWKLVHEQKTRGIFFDAIAFWDRDRGIVVSDPVDGRFAPFTTADAG